MTKKLNVKIYGLQRTGTNYAQKLLELNYHINIWVNKGGWKHGVYCLSSRLNEEVDCLVIAKHPLAWLDSWHRRKFQGQSINRQDWIAENIAHYNALYNNWTNIKLKKHRLIISRYEDMLHNPKAECGRIAEQLGADADHQPFYDFRNTIKPATKEGTEPFDKSYYLEYKFMQKFDDKSIGTVDEHIDKTLLDHLNYNIPPQY